MRPSTLLSMSLVFASVGLSCSGTPPPTMTCSSANCGGCCDQTTNKCISGVELSACGRGGQACVSCPSNFQCVVGSCTAPNGAGGGSAVGGGFVTGGGAAGGGSSGGGAAGGGSAVGGGSVTGGGSSGGGAAGGGSSGGGAAGGGSSGGGAAGGGSAGGAPISCTTGCVSPPPARCSNANTLVTPQANGTCINAQCVFSENQAACPYGCVNNACALPSTCTPNSKRCNGTQIQTCNSNGSAWLFAQNCTGTCTAGLCDAPCTPSARRCNGNDLQTCNSGGTAWASMMSCAQGCVAGACLTDVLEVNGNTVTMDGEYRYSQRVTVKNGGRIQVTPGRKLTIYAPIITVEISSFISGTGMSGGTCAAPPDDVFQGIRLIANQVTIDGSVTWSGSSCAKNGVVIRAGTIDGAGTVTSNARSLLLYGAGGVAPGLMATGATRSLMPPEVITSSNYPEGGTYNDDGPPPVYTWSKPATNITGYYYTVGFGSQTPVATSSFLGVEALAGRETPPVGKTFLDVVSIDSTGTIGTVPHEFVIDIVGAPPQLASPTNPVQGMFSPNPTVVMAWDGGNPTVGYYRVFDRYPTTRPTPATGTFEQTNKNPPQVLLQNVADGRWWFHMIALDSMGYSTRSAAHYEVAIGMAADAGTIAGKVTGPNDAGIAGATVVVQRGLYVTTTAAGGVYTFNGQIPAGTYEVVAKDERPDAGQLQAKAAMVTVTPATTTELNFALSPGSGCPTCTDVCSGVACGAPDIFCAPGGRGGTCRAGVCVNDSSFRLANVGVTTASTVGQPDVHYSSYYGSSSYRGGDVTFVFIPPTTRVYSVSMDSTDPNASLISYVTSAAPCSTSVSTSSTSFVYQGGSARTYSLTAGVPLFIIVDSDVGYEAPFELTIN